MEQSSDYDTLYREFSSWCLTLEGPLDLCGLSLGGVLALDFACHFPQKVHSLVLIGTPYQIPKLAFGLQNMVFHLLPEKAFQGMGSSKENIIALTGSMKRLDIPAMAEKVQCRTLILCGEKDSANRKSGALLNNAILHSRFALVAGAAHEVNTDNPSGLADILMQFWA